MKAKARRQIVIHTSCVILIFMVSPLWAATFTVTPTSDNDKLEPQV